MQKIFKLIITLLLVLSISGCGLLNGDIYILFTSDVHSNINGNITYAQLKAYKNRLEKETKNVVLVDGGDFSNTGSHMEGEIIGDTSKGLAIVEIMNEVGYDFATIGNHEFDYGFSALKDMIDTAKFQVICANVDYIGNNEDPFEKVKPYEIKKCGSKKIAFIGVTSPTAILKGDDERNDVSEDGKVAVDLHGDPRDEDDDGSKLCAYMQEIINEARSKADYVVVISHLGNNSNEILSSYDLITYTNGIDLLLDGHAHNTLNEKRLNNQGEEVQFLSTGTELNTVGIVKIARDGTLTADYIYGIDEVDVKTQNKIDEIVSKY